MHNKDKSWFDDQCRRAFDLKQEVHPLWTRDRSQINLEAFVLCQLRANELLGGQTPIYCQNKDVLNYITYVSGRVRLDVSCYNWTVMVAMTHWVYFLSF